MKSGEVLCVACIAIWSMVNAATSATLAALLLVNGILQIGLFTLVACIPFLKTGRMSFVDIAWPFGVALIGLQILLLGDEHALRKWATGGV